MANPPGDDLGALAVQFRRFATGAGRDNAPLYEAICNGIADDEDMLRLVGPGLPLARRPNLVLAAVHYLLLAGTDHPLGSLYPTVAQWRAPSSPRSAPSSTEGDEPDPDGGRNAGDPAEVFRLFKDFSVRFASEVGQLMTTRSTQTNEVGRCSALLPAFSLVASRSDQPLALVDLGTSAGLNLLFDRYGYRYWTRRFGRVSEIEAGDPGSPVRLEAELRHRCPETFTVPPVTTRLGIDRDPADPMDDDRSLWLLACQWPDHADRFLRLHLALLLARSSPDRPRLIVADAVEDLGEVAVLVPETSRLCIFHSWMAAYLTPARQVALGSRIRALAQHRPVTWIFAENRFETPGLPHPGTSGKGIPGASSLVLVEHHGDRQQSELLAEMHPHGRWIHWWKDRSGI